MEKVTQQTITNAADALTALTELTDLRMNELARLVCTQYSGDNLVVTPDGDDLEFDIQCDDNNDGGIVYLNRDSVSELHKVLGDWLVKQNNGDTNGTKD